MFPHGGTSTVTTTTSWDNLVDAFNVWLTENGMNILLGMGLAVVILLALVVISMHDDREG